MIVAGQLVVIEETRFPHGGCVGMTLGSREGLEASGADRVWHVVLTQHSFMTHPGVSWQTTTRTPKKRFLPVLELYLRPSTSSSAC